ncbi:hypothetical protein ACFXTH_004604 [Malus domestica]
MELFYLLCSILSTLLPSLTLSLSPSSSLSTISSAASLHAPPLPLPPSSTKVPSGASAARPVHHTFRYAVHYALIDLDHTPQPLPNHLSAKEARRIAGTDGRTLLLTIPQSVGYEQNPLSLYYCYDVGDLLLKKCIAEVTNTPWGERVTFLFNPNSDLVAKPCPFMDMLGNWSIRANAPAATLKAKRVSSSFASDHALFFWLKPNKVAVWIYWHAFKLWWKNVSFVQHPRYSNPAYREEALVRDQKLQCCQAVGYGEDKPHLQPKGSRQGCIANGKSEARFCTWRDAKVISNRMRTKELVLAL